MSKTYRDVMRLSDDYDDAKLIRRGPATRRRERRLARNTRWSNHNSLQ